ncbi:MAG: trypsin-like peptidase domain-containing protein [Propionicimonas sp.]
MAHSFVRTAAALVAAPVLALSFALPAGATAVAVRYRQPFEGWQLVPNLSRTSQPEQNATLASSTQSTGVVLIDTTVDYGVGAAAGTGLVLSSDGIVVTNHHVVKSSTQVEVTDPATGNSYTADVIGYDPKTDVAVLKLEDASGLATVATDTSAVATGDDVTAVGNSNGGGVLTAASGEVTDTDSDINVSGDDGSTEHLTDLIEVDATVVPGDSGGALLDDDGEVVGMNVAASSNGSTGYAIPISTVLNLADQILAGDASGAVTLGYGPALGLQLNTQGSHLLVVGVVNGSAADQAGVTPGSVLTEFNGEQLSDYSDLTAAMAKLSPGDTAKLSWVDADGTAQSATVTLGRAPLA